MKIVLSIDGGGIRGIIPAKIIHFIETLVRCPVMGSIDMIAGTSTGGIIALALAEGWGTADIVDMYRNHGEDIFRRKRFRWSMFRSKYDNDGLRRVLGKYLKKDFGDSKVKLLIPAYDTERRRPVFFKSWRNSMSDIKSKDVALATSAAPTYFPAVRVEVEGRKRSLIDGGVEANNPAMCALAECRKIYPGEKVFVISLGTGSVNRPYPYKKVRKWGSLQWAPKIPSVFLDGQSDTVDHQLEHILGGSYARIQVDLRASDDMDDASWGNIQELEADAMRSVSDSRRTVDRIVNVLKDARSR